MSTSELTNESDDTDLPPHPPADSPGGLEIRFRPDVEGLRAVAVTVVVLYHAGVSWFRGGFIGVDVFFVISGFLITSLLVREHDSRRRISIVGFYARRARRILPAGMIVIMATVFLAYFMQNLFDFQATAMAGRWAALFAANFHFAKIGQDYFSQSLAPSPLRHYWSLAVEEQFYLAWPITVIAIGLIVRRGSIRVVVAVVATIGTVASFLWSLQQTTADPVWAYYSPFTRAWELGLGAAIACAVPLIASAPRRIGTALAWLGLVAIAYGCAAFTDQTAFPGWAALVPVLGAGAIIAGGTMRGGQERKLATWRTFAAPVGLGAIAVALMVPLSTSTPVGSWGWEWVVLSVGAAAMIVGADAPSTTLLGLRPMRAVGRVSYGWYLLHYPLMVLLAGKLWTGPLPVWENLVIAVGTLAASFAMFSVLERPIRRSRYLAVRPWTSVAMGAAFVALAFLFSWAPTPSLHWLWTN
jgi:peptidoglycan/LPS O-acetylase OafA/YrhL